MRKVTLRMLLLAMLLGLIYCSQVVSDQVIKSKKQRDNSPKVDATDVATQVSGNNAFAFNLYQLCTLKNASII